MTGNVEEEKTPSLEPYVGRLERFELFSTHQCYYLVAGNKTNTQFRILKMDRTLIERPASQQETKAAQETAPSLGDGQQQAQNGATLADNSHAPKTSLRPLSDFLIEDPNVYSQEEIRDLLDTIHDGNRMRRVDKGLVDASRNGGGGLKPLVKAYGIVGFARFLDCYYLTLITRRAKVGTIGGNSIYTIKSTETIPLKPAERSPIYGADDGSDPSSVLLSMWNRGKRSVGLGLSPREIAELRYQGLYQVMDLTKGFYFSYTYDLTRSLQENFLLTATKPFPPPSSKEMYTWNHFLTREFDACLDSSTGFYWLHPLIHGSFVQRRVYDYGRSLEIVLVAKRSRHFAGTRYLKRGVSENGYVANDVEHEQILHDDSTSSPGVFCSYIQVRGSIPTFWSQESSVTMPKPPIELNRVDPSYRATQAHFEDLLKRYSSPILVLDLVKQNEKREREVRVGNEFRHAIDHVNTSMDENHQIRYCGLDYSHISKHKYLDVSTSLNEASIWAVNQTGFFCSSPCWKIVNNDSLVPFSDEDRKSSRLLSKRLGVHFFPMEQSGILRTNCIDCLDRTNVAQFSAGVEAISQQLVVLGVRSRTRLDPSSNIVRVLIDMYVEIGDNIALQYGGSEAHKKVTADHAESSNITGPIGKHKELLTSIRRYYSNAFTDRLKQDAINLFLGHYLPYRHKVPLWEMENDYYLHNQAGAGVSMNTYKRAFGITWKNADLGGIAALPSPMGGKVDGTGRVASMGESNGKGDEESERVKLVRSMCDSQKEQLSAWWKHALQANIQQRMWMQLGKGQADIQIPLRFERIYEPEKLSQFDRFFSRAWATPVRRTHAAQHSEGIDERVGDLSRWMSPDTVESKDGPREPKLADYDIRLDSFLERYGHEPRSESLLRRFADYHSKQTKVTADAAFVGHIDVDNCNPRPEYVKYVRGDTSDEPVSFHPERIEEFKACLGDCTLASDDVDGIREQAVSSHLGETIHHGPYEGLSKSTSAIKVATAIQEQFDTFESVGTGGRLVERELRRRGLFQTGVRTSIAEGIRHFTIAEKQYEEVLDSTRSTCRRSDLSTTESFRLYSSNFDRELELSPADQTFLLARQPDAIPPGPSHVISPEAPSNTFLKKATRLGVSVIPREEYVIARLPPIFPLERRRISPEGFEQINDDLFARKTNKYMVFNFAGAMFWTGTNPVTRVFSSDAFLLSSKY